MSNTSLHELLRWANAMYRLETPDLAHSPSVTDEGGAPDMAPAAKSYLGLASSLKVRAGAPTRRFGEGADPTTWTGPPDPADNWYSLACRVDKESGMYLTPLRCAVAGIRDVKLRGLLRDIVPELYFPSEILAIHGYVEKWEQNAVLRAALTILFQRWALAPAPRRSWSESQQNANAAA